MNIGIVTTWFERGAAYVSRQYKEALEKEGHNIFIFARGGEELGKTDINWNGDNVTWGPNSCGTSIGWNKFSKWIKSLSLDVIFFNEQQDITIVLQTKIHFPNIKVGSYIDYYRQDTISEFNYYDFLICNTQRHFEVFKDHPQAFYIPWGTNIDLFKPSKIFNKKQVVFFHSCGMSNRKGTMDLIEAFQDKELYENAKLIIHSQIEISRLTGFNEEQLSKYNIEIIHKTVGAPGLYHLGDVYVYPTTLEGIGLTIYEALSCGLPVIVPNNAPMNEVIIHNYNGKLVDVKEYRTRADAYYWPLCSVDSKILASKMKEYINHPTQVTEHSINARLSAETKLNWASNSSEISSIFRETDVIVNTEKAKQLLNNIKRKKLKNFLASLIDLAPTSSKISFFNIYNKMKS